MLRFHPLKVTELRVEPEEAIYLTLALPAAIREEYRFAAGQHIGLRALLGGEELRRTYSLVNLLSDFHEHIVPEFVPWYGAPDGVANYAIDLLNNPKKLRNQRQRLRHLVQGLDKPGASMNVARLALEMVNAS